MIKDFIPRLYQQTIFATCASRNSLVVLPTGLGKTNIFLMTAAQRLKEYPKSKVLLIGPTRPLIDQYFRVFQKHFEIDEKDMCILTGMVKPEKRAELWENSKIVFSTPQGLENDIISGRITFKDVSLLGVDEAHRAVGDYSYVWIAKQYQKTARYPRIIAMTASPGSDLESITEVCGNLSIEDIEIRTYEDEDVKPYIQEIDVQWIKVDLTPELVKIQKFLKDCYLSKIEEAKKYGQIFIKGRLLTRTDILSLQAKMHGEIAKGNKDFSILKTISLLAEAMKVAHALELLESQGIKPLQKYLSKIETDAKTSKVKAVQNLMADSNFKSAIFLVKGLKDTEHPKLTKLRELVIKEKAKTEDIKLIIFTQYRDSAKDITDMIEKIEGMSARVFVGQSKKNGTGISQKEQIKLIDEFKEGIFNTIVMTSVGEEGLDIPKVDMVIFYEPVPSEIRHIQRRGRTGRQDKGNVFILMTKGTRDESYRWASHAKEKRMYSTLREIKKKIGGVLGDKNQKTLDKFDSPPSLLTENSYEEKTIIYIDHREKSSGVVKSLLELGMEVKLEKLDNADYILSERVGIEYKTVEDFVNSLVDGRLLEQIKGLKKNFERPIVIVEGTHDIYSVRKVHPNAIRGMLAMILVSYGIPILYTKTTAETAGIMHSIAKREQVGSGKIFSPHSSKKTSNDKETQEYIVSSLPDVGPTLAKELLEKFGTIKKVINAKEDKLKKVAKIGEKKAKKIFDIINKEYEK